MAKRFISFEGIDGSGKTTQLEWLAEHLAKQHAKVVISHEPYGEDIRALLHQSALEYTPLAQLFLLSASRHQHLDKKIRPALAEGAIVLCDRYIDSTLAYQGYGFGLEQKVIEQVNQLATGGLVPDISFILDMDVEVMFKRIKARGDISSYESQPRDFYQRVREGFLRLAEAEPERCKVIASDGSPQEIAEQIKGYL